MMQFDVFHNLLQVSALSVPFDDLEYAAADYINFIHRSPRALQDKIQQAKEHLGEWGLGVNDNQGSVAGSQKRRAS